MEILLVKLKTELEQEIKSEAQLVYVFSLIRKILESQKLKNEYKKLNFYSNWALHAELDKTDALVDVLSDFDNDENKYNFLSFKSLKDDLTSFLEFFKLPKKIIDNDFDKILNLLIIIYEYCPLYFPVDNYSRKKVIIKKNKYKLANEIYSVAYAIEYESKKNLYI